MDGFRFSSVPALWFKSTPKFRRRGLERSPQGSLKIDLSRLWPPGVSQLQEEGAGRKLADAVGWALFAQLFTRSAENFVSTSLLVPVP